MGNLTSYYCYWGKASLKEELACHLLPYHSLDVAAVGNVILEQADIVEQFSRLTALDVSNFRLLFVFVLALHDVGKFAESFQNLQLELLRRLQNKTSQRKYLIRHDTLGWLWWQERGKKIFRELGLLVNAQGSTRRQQMETPFDAWLQAVMGHHGIPPRSDLQTRLNKDFSADDLAVVDTFARELADLLLPTRQCLSEFSLLTIKRASWWIAGLAVFCDWLGSNRKFFPYETQHLPLADYWQRAIEQAKKALQNIGILKGSVSTSFTLAKLLPTSCMASPLQDAVNEQKISPKPQLFVLEDVTGAGKTEAALLLTHKLMRAGHGNGFYFALPTMATANAMYERVGKIYRQMFVDETAPSLVLAHSASSLSQEFQQSVIETPPSAPIYANGDAPAEAHCNAWLADNRKKALLADVGVGTIDQSLLAILPARHQSLRLFGLLGKIIIVDEVHACDTYMHELLQALLYAHALAGGSAVLLSATMTHRQRQQLVHSYAKGRGTQTQPVLASNSYPLLTSSCGEKINEQPVVACSSSARDIAVEFLTDHDSVYDLLYRTAIDGNCACWIRNTVADAIDAYQKIKNRYPQLKVSLFHARYALGDRLAIEKQVIEKFGKENKQPRSGQILIATQVVEQSLDLDFDELISDLAPIDLLIQRAGRLRRHSRDKQGKVIVGIDQRGKGCLHIFSPPFCQTPDKNWYQEFFPQASHVYPKHGQLWLTVKILTEKKNIKIPQDVRALLEYVYAEDPDLPEALQQRELRTYGQESAERSLAHTNKLNIDQGYSRLASDSWWDESLTPTRLGELTKNVYLVKWQANELHPWHGKGEKQDWHLSSVSVRNFYADSETDTVPAKQLAKCKDNLPMQGKWAVILPLTKCDDRWQGQISGAEGKVHTVSYSSETGLELGDDR